MERLTGKQAQTLAEAYAAVYTSQELTEEQVWEEPETANLIPSGRTAGGLVSLNKPYPSQLGGKKGEVTYQKRNDGEVVSKFRKFPKFADLRGGSNTPAAATPEPQRGSTDAQGKFYTGKQYGYQSWQTASAKRLLPSEFLGSEPPTAATAATPNTAERSTAAATPNTAGAPPKPPTGSPGAPAKPSPTPTPSPSPAPSRSSSSATASTADKIKGGMDVYNKQRSSGDFKGASETGKSVWALANPKLAAAAAEKARIRGTSQSDNPLMKGMPGKRPMTPSVQSPTLAKDLGKGSGNQSLLDNPNASKAAPPKAAPTTAPKPTATPARNGFGVSAAPIAAKASVATTTATPTPAAAKPATPKPSLQDTIKKNRGITSSFDLFDLVKGHLLDEGYAESEDAAMVIMVNMSEEWRESILESYGVELVMELTGGKGHPGYKAGSRDLGPMQSGHPADSRKRQVDGGTMSQRHGYHLGDIDDDDDDEDEDEYESIVKQQSRDKREILRKPLRDKVKAARKKMTKEGIELEDILALSRRMEKVYEAQHARENPEKYERDERKSQSNRERRMNDPNTGINSPAFQAFMAQQMGGKKKKKD